MSLESRHRHHASGLSRGLVVALLAGGALAASPAAAQDSGRWEVGAFAGGSFGTRTYQDARTQIAIGSGAAFGLRGAFSIDRSFSLEASVSRSSALLRGVNPSTGASLAPSAPIDVTTYELDGLYGFGGGRLRGYMGLGM